MISATNGHDVKYSASEKLKNEVDEWLKKKGNKVKQIKCTLRGYDDIPKDEFNSTDRLSKAGRKQVKVERTDMKMRQAVQIPILKEYFDLMNHKLCFKEVAVRMNGRVSTTHLRKTMLAGTSIKNPVVWRGVVNTINEILKERGLK